MIIKIKRDTIRRNPNAGNTSFDIPTVRSFRLTYYGEVPESIKPYVGIVFTKWQNSKVVEQEALVVKEHEKVFEILKEDKEVFIAIDQEYTTVRHAPEAEYLYEYENPFVECFKCHSRVRANDVSVDDNGFLECPKCLNVDCFGFDEFEYEEIEDVLKNDSERSHK